MDFNFYLSNYYIEGSLNNMDVIKYFELKDRLCDSSEDCHVCLLGSKYCMTKIPSRLEENIKILEQWEKDNLIKTNLDVVAEGLEKLGYNVYKEALRSHCPPAYSSLYSEVANECGQDDPLVLCSKCRKWWDEPYKEDK